MTYRITQVNDRDTMEQVEILLHREGIQKDEDYRIVATGSCFGNTLRCFAVRSDHQGEGLLNEIATHLIQFQFERGNFHLFLVSEDASLVPWSVRKRLVLEGTAHLNNIIYHDSGPYIISNATFPSYFLKDETAVIEGHARLDLAVFQKIADVLGIRCRYVGEEPFSQVTGIYNRIMKEELPKSGVECVVVPRKEQDGRAISASIVRQCIQSGDIDAMAKLVPEPTLRYFQSVEAAPVIARIRETGDVAHDAP